MFIFWFIYFLLTFTNIASSLSLWKLKVVNEKRHWHFDINSVEQASKPCKKSPSLTRIHEYSHLAKKNVLWNQMVYICVCVCVCVYVCPPLSKLAEEDILLLSRRVLTFTRWGSSTSTACRQWYQLERLEPFQKYYLLNYSNLKKSKIFILWSVYNTP